MILHDLGQEEDSKLKRLWNVSDLLDLLKKLNGTGPTIVELKQKFNFK